MSSQHDINNGRISGKRIGYRRYTVAWFARLMLLLTLGYQNLTLTYKFNADFIVLCTSVVDLGINVHSNLKYGSHCATIASKANERAKLILKSFLFHNSIRPI